MKKIIDKNIEIAKNEIWRRQKLLIASIAMYIPYQFIAILILSKIFGLGATAEISSFFFYLFFIYLVSRWVQSAPCPTCGVNWGGSFGTRGNNCTSCGQSLKPTPPLSYRLFLKNFEYEYPQKPANRVVGGF